MYKETDSRKTGFGVVAVFVLTAIAVHTVLSFLPLLNVIKDIAFMAAMVSFVLVLIKRYLTVYEYELTDEKIIITARLGDRERARAEAEYTSIKYFGSAECSQNADAKIGVFCTKKENRYAILFESENGKMKIIFAPTSEMVALIENKLQSLAKEE